MREVEINVLVLAYLGDTIYEKYVRKHFINKGVAHVKELQEEVIPYVSAKGQASYLDKLIRKEFFSDEELSVIKRARNAKGHHHPKNCDVLTYKHATALEAVIGYLDLIDRKNRINEIMMEILEEEKDVSVW